MLADAAGTHDPDGIVNPQHYAMPASPYTAWMRGGEARPDMRRIMDCYHKLKAAHEAVVVEGIGGVMTPILPGYFVVDMIRDMGLPAVVVCSDLLGTINHTVLTVQACRARRVRVGGVVINSGVGAAGARRYNAAELAQDLGEICGVRLLGHIPHVTGAECAGQDTIAQTLGRMLDLSHMIGGRGE